MSHYLHKKLAIPTLTGLKFLCIDKIVHLQSDEDYTTFFLTGKTQFTSSRPLKWYVYLLRNHHFIRIHQSHFINTDCLADFKKGKYSTVIMDDGSQIDVSRRCKGKFRKFFE